MKNLTPITRKEMFMAKAAGQDVTPPEPITREEMFLSDIAEHEEGQGSGGGGSGADIMIVNFLWDEDYETVIGADKTYAEITSAFMNGTLIFGGSDGVFAPLSMEYNPNTQTPDYQFNTITVEFGDSFLRVTSYSMTSDGSVTVSNKSISIMN